MVAPNVDSVEYDILIKAAQALDDLKQLTASASTFADRITMATAAVKKFSAETGISLKGTVAMFREIDSMAGEGQQVFENVKQGWSEVGRAAEDGGRRAVRSIDAVRIALGALVAMLVFQVIQAIGNAFREMISNIKEAELAVYNLINAERRLSQEGIDVTPKGLQETIDAVQKLVPILSKIQAEELVSRIATNVAPALHLTNEQIGQLSESIALLYVRNKALGKSFDEVEAQVTNAFLTGKVSQGINQLGVKISDQIVKDEALRLGLVKSEKEFDNLSGEVQAHVKSVAMLSVVYKNAKQDMGSVGDYMGTLDAQSSRLQTAWSNLLTTVGQIFGPALAQIFSNIAQDLETVNMILEAIKPALKDIVAYSVAWAAVLQDYPKYLKLGGGKEFVKDFADNVQKAQKSMMELADVTDTATSAQDAYNNSVDNFKADEFIQKIEDIKQATMDSFSDLQTKLIQKISDINLEYDRKAADAHTDYVQKLEDIDRKYAQDVQDIKNKQRAQDKKDEEKYQLQLWELRQKYLMDLEDALHARDARQILRLQRQYAFDKEDLARKHALETKQRNEDQRAELEDAKKKADEARAQAKLDYQRKLEDQRIAKQRELADLQTWYLREFRDMQTAQQRKLQALIKGWIDEQKITASNAAQVYAILAKYFGPGGMTDQLYQYMVSSLVANTQAAVSSLGSIGSMGGSVIGGGRSSGTGTTGSRSPSTGGSSPRSRAEGGVMVASRPTNVTFGEAGAEAALFLPMNKIGRNAGRVDFNGGSSGMDGQIVVRLDLSPDLEARVVENSMNGVANVITKINRSKV